MAKRSCPGMKAFRTLSPEATRHREKELRGRGFTTQRVKVEGVGTVLTKKRNDLPGWTLALGGGLLALLVLRSRISS